MTHESFIERAEEAHIAAYPVIFERCALHNVDFAGLVLKASMVLPGESSGKKASPEDVAEATMRCFSKPFRRPCLLLSSCPVA